MNFTAMAWKIISFRKAALAVKWSNGFALLAGAIFMLSGTARVFQSFAVASVLDASDPVFDFKFRYLILLSGLVEIVIACFCLFATRRAAGFGLVAWWVVVFATYRIEIWTMGWYHPWVFVGDLTSTLNISPLAVDKIVVVVVGILLAGSSAVLWSGRERRVLRTRNQAGAAETIKMFCALCNGHILFAAENLGQKIACPHCKATITMMRPKNIKTACPACGGHIEVPLYGLDKKYRVRIVRLQSLCN